MSVSLRLLAAAAASLAMTAAAPAPLDPKAVAITPFDQLPFKGKPGEQQAASVFGDRSKPEFYGYVMTLPPHTLSHPHSHPNDRYVQVLSGTWWVGTGARFHPETMTPVKAGSFVVDRAGEIHYDGARDEPVTIYIVGMGPAPLIDREEK